MSDTDATARFTPSLFDPKGGVHKAATYCAACNTPARSTLTLPGGRVYHCCGLPACVTALAEKQPA